MKFQDAFYGKLVRSADYIFTAPFTRIVFRESKALKRQRYREQQELESKRSFKIHPESSVPLLSLSLSPSPPVQQPKRNEETTPLIEMTTLGETRRRRSSGSLASSESVVSFHRRLRRRRPSIP